MDEQKPKPTHPKAAEIGAMLAGLAMGASVPARDNSIPVNYRCTKCDKMGEHAPSCTPPRGLKGVDLRFGCID